MRLVRCGLMASERSDDTIICHLVGQCVSIETEHKSQSHARQSFIKNEFVIIIVTANISFQFEIDYSLRRRFHSALPFGVAIENKTLPHHVHVSLFASPDRLVIKWRRVCYNGKANRNIIAYSTPRDIVTGETSSRVKYQPMSNFEAGSVVF